MGELWGDGFWNKRNIVVDEVENLMMKVRVVIIGWCGLKEFDCVEREVYCLGFEWVEDR